MLVSDIPDEAKILLNPIISNGISNDDTLKSAEDFRTCVEKLSYCKAGVRSKTAVHNGSGMNDHAFYQFGSCLSKKARTPFFAVSADQDRAWDSRAN